MNRRRSPAPSSGDAVAALGRPLPYFDRELRTEALKILPGGYLATSQNLLLVTLLGSCIAVCLHDPLAGIGGMNHFMLPEGSVDSVVSGPARYGVYAMEVLLNDLLKGGAARGRLQAKVFGGGHVLKSLGSNPVGEQNHAFIRTYLQREGIPVLAEDTLGLCPRKVGFFPKTGRALVKRLPRTQGEDVARLETTYRKRLRHDIFVPEPIEIFQP